jgi:hypothetical protein
MVVVKLKDLVKSRQIKEYQGNYLLNMLYLIIAEINEGTKSDIIENNFIDLDLADENEITKTQISALYPNPSRNAVTISYEIAENETGSEKVVIQVYDVIGRLVSNLVNENMAPGRYTATWKGNFDSGEMASWGYYFVRLSAGKTREVKQILLVR